MATAKKTQRKTNPQRDQQALAWLLYISAGMQSNLAVAALPRHPGRHLRSRIESAQHALEQLKMEAYKLLREIPPG